MAFFSSASRDVPVTYTFPQRIGGLPEIGHQAAGGRAVSARIVRLTFGAHPFEGILMGAHVTAITLFAVWCSRNLSCLKGRSTNLLANRLFKEPSPLTGLFAKLRISST